MTIRICTSWIVPSSRTGRRLPTSTCAQCNKIPPDSDWFAVPGDPIPGENRQSGSAGSHFCQRFYPSPVVLFLDDKGRRYLCRRLIGSDGSVSDCSAGKEAKIFPVTTSLIGLLRIIWTWKKGSSWILPWWFQRKWIRTCRNPPPSWMWAKLRISSRRKSSKRHPWRRR